MNERFTIKSERPDRPPSVTEEGVVSGEIGRVDPVEAEAEPSETERLRLIEAAARQDGMLAKIFDDIVVDDPRERAAAILDRLNALRRELDRSDLDPTLKRERDLWLSDIANRLRELL
jgi:hypothetical protein